MSVIIRPYEDRLRCFDELWQTLLTDLEPLRVVSIEYAFRFLEGEVQLQRLRNKSLRQVLARLIYRRDRWLLKEPPALHAVRAILASEVQDGYSQRTVALSEEGMQYFTRGDYVCSLLRFIETRICSTEKLTSDFRSAVTDLAISFLLRGFGLSGLRTLLTEAFFERTMMHGQLLHTTYPCDALDPSLPDLDLTSPESVTCYNNTLQASLNGLTITDRFASIWKVYQRQPKPLTYVFPISGLKGRQTFNIGRVEVYNPFVSPKVDKAAETIGRDRPDSLSAAIQLSSLNSEEDRGTAARQVQAHLDAVAFFVSSRVPIEVDGDKCVILNEGGALYGEAIRNPRLAPSLEHKYFARDADELMSKMANVSHVFDIASKVGALEADAEVRIQEALRAIIKSTQTEVLEDRLVNAWIAIEALMGRAADKEEIAAQMLPALAANDARFGVGWSLLSFLRQCAANRQAPPFSNVFARITEDMLQRSSVITDPWGTVELGAFVASLDEWLDKVPEGSECLRRIYAVRSFYSTPEAAVKEIKRRQEVAAEDAVFIYQVRNRIVHHAFLGSPGMNYLVNRAETFARLFMLSALRNLEKTPERLIGNEVVKARLLIERIENDPTFNLISSD
jgi:hypothetical protein